MPVYLMPD